MDREQAIKIIKDCKEKSFKRTLYTLNEYHEALDMAIEALEQQSCKNAISREDVLDEINRIGVKAFETYNDYSELFDFVDSLPSVNPQANKEDIHREREQAYMRGYEDGSRKYRTEQSEDVISRQAVIDGLASIAKAKARSDAQKAMMGRTMFFVEQLPSVSTENTGRWIEQEGYDGDTYYDCSECGESFCLIDGTPTDNLYNYCPNCGARMGVEE